MISGLCFCVSVLALGVAARALTRMFGPRRGAGYLMGLLFWLCFLTAGSVLAAGMAGYLTPIGVTLVSVFLAVLFYTCAGNAGRNAGIGFRFFPCDSEARIAVWASVFLLVLMFLRHGVVTWLFPPHVYDVLTYHLPKVADWIQSGSLAIQPTPVLRSYWPANMELIQAWWMVFPHHDVVVELAGVPFWMLGGLSVYVIGGALGARRSAALLAACAFLSTPIFLQNAVSGKNDIAVAAVFLFAVALVLPAQKQGFTSMGILVPVAAAFLFAVGTKPTILFMAPAWGIWFLIARPWRRAEERVREPGPAARFPGAAVGVVLALGMLLAGAWYVRNAVQFGNPFYPTAFHLFGLEWPGGGGGGGQQGGFRPASALETLRAVWERRLLDRGGPYSPEAGHMTGWGWFAYAVGWPAVVVALRKRGFRSLALLFAAAAFLVLCFVDTDPWNMRFLMWFPALFGIALAVALQQLRTPAIRQAVIYLTLGCLGLNLLGALNNGWFSVADWKRFARTPWSERVIGTDYETFWKAIPPGETLGYFMGSNDAVYVLRGPRLQRRVEMLQVTGLHRDYAEAMDRQGLNFLAYPARDRDPAWRKPFEEQVRAGQFTRLREGLYVRARAGENP